MKLGNLDISTVKLGASQVQAVYQGDSLVWQNAPVATAATGVGQTSFTANWDAYTGATYYLLDVSESSDFSTFIYQNQIVEAPNTSYVVIGLNSNTTYYYRVRASDDADSLGFFQRVNIAGGTLTSTEQIAIIDLVQDLKADGIWTKMKAIYPMVGASAAACAQNLKSSSFTGTFTAGWTFASTGVTPNGTSAYMDTGYNASTLSDSTSDFHLSIYQIGISTTGQSRCKIGASSNAITLQNGTMLAFYSGGTVEIGMVAGDDFNDYAPSGSSPASEGLFTITTNTNRNAQHYKNSSANGSAVNQGSGIFPNFNFYLGAENRVGTAASFFNKTIGLTTIGTGLSSSDVSDFYTAVQAFQTTLSRQV